MDKIQEFRPFQKILKFISQGRKIKGKSTQPHYPPTKSYLFVVVLPRQSIGVSGRRVHQVKHYYRQWPPSSLVSLRLACNVNWTCTYILRVYGWKGVVHRRVALTIVSRRRRLQRAVFHRLCYSRLTIESINTVPNLSVRIGIAIVIVENLYLVIRSESSDQVSCFEKHFLARRENIRENGIESKE